MTQDEIIRMAHESGCYEKYEIFYFTIEQLEQLLNRFAAPVREDEAKGWRESNKRDYEHWKWAAEQNHSGEATDMVQPVGCPDCNGSGEMETGIGMLPCDSCHGSCVKESLTVQAAVLAEREAIAKLIESGEFGIGNMMSMHNDESVAAAIRARGNHA